MKKLLSVLTLLVIISTARTQNKTIWYTPVQRPVNAWDLDYNNITPLDLAEDLAKLLQESTGTIFSLKPYDGKSKEGVFILIDSARKYSANEAALVNSDGSTYLKITSRYVTGLSYGVYTYLEKLGFKFYLPGDNWTITPSLSSIYKSNIKNEEWKPYFKVRTSFVSGAMHPVKDMDPGSKNYKNWLKWFRRNRMGNEYMGLGGHIGEQFNIENQKQLEKDSLILAPVNGKRQYDVSAKIDPTYDKGINMFVDWIIKQYKSERSTVPFYLPAKTYQSIDPGDGLNYCYSPACMAKYRSISDQVFAMANKAAVKIRSLYPEAGVNLYAYTERADTPTMKLEPNVHVGIVANAFQNVSTPMGLINRWAKKTTHISIYDYLNIGVWNKDFPYFNLDRYHKYLEHIKALKLEGFVFESGGSSLSAGIIQYMVLKYLCNPYADINKEFEEFCKTSFGNAAEPVSKLMHEWYFSEVKIGSNYDEVTFNEVEIGRFVNYLQQADNAVGLTTIQKKRLLELKAYTVYLAGYYEMKADLTTIIANKNNPSYLKDKTEELLRFTWMLYPSMIFHNTQLADIFKGNFNGDAALLKKWNYSTSDIFKNITANSERTVNERFSAVYKKYTAKAGTPFASGQSIIDKAYLQKADTVKIRLIDAAALGSHRDAVEVYCAAPTKITIQYEAVREKPKENTTVDIGFIALTKDDYSFHTDIPLYSNKLKGSVSFSLPQKGYYKFMFGQNNSTAFDLTILPGQSLLYINKNTIPMNCIMLLDDADGKYKCNKYLAVYTGDADNIDFGMLYPDCVNYVNIYNNKGQKKELQNNIVPYLNISTKIKAEEKNTFMFFSNGLFRWPPVFKNIPPYYFFLKPPAALKK